MAITSIQFVGFKSLEKYSVSLKEFNVLVGPNNAGKSTVLDGLRLIWGANRFARQRKATFLPQSRDGIPQGWGWQIPPSSLPFDLENIHTNYRTDPGKVSIRLQNGNRLNLWLGNEGRSQLLMESEHSLPRSTTAFRKQFDLRLAIVPTLGPFEREEEAVGAEYLDRVAWSHRASRLFRNLWLNDPSNFEEFRLLVESTWPGVTIAPPERSEIGSNRLVMFCKENSITREIAWAGSGFQIWLQILTHLVRARDANVLVVDEPEIYLHPDLQRQIVRVLKRHSAQVAIATHSVEIINEVDPSDVLLVERHRQAARRLTDVDELVLATQLLGSSQNMQLSRLARSRRVLFVEGLDKEVLSRLAAKLDLDLFSNGKLTVIPMGGFSQYHRVSHAQWAFLKVLGQTIDVAVLLDRDYRCDAEVDEVLKGLAGQTSLSMVLAYKEIENSVLVPRAIQSVVDQKLRLRVEHGTLSVFPKVGVAEILSNCADSVKEDVRAQSASAEIRHFRANKTDVATVLLEHGRRFEEKWQNLEKRMALVPGKALLTLLNTTLQEKYGVSVSVPQIISHMHRDEVETNLARFLTQLAAMTVRKS